MMRRARIAGAIAALVLLLLLAGCYTVLRHPTGTDVVSTGPGYRTCADCHADAAFYHPYYHYGRSHRWWGAYSGYPWWYHDYWWYPDGYDPDDVEGPPVEKGSRHLWSSGGWPSGGWGFTAPPSSDGGTERPQNQPPKQHQQSQEQKKDDEKKEEKDERHLWDQKKKGF